MTPTGTGDMDRTLPPGAGLLLEVPWPAGNGAGHPAEGPWPVEAVLTLG